MNFENYHIYWGTQIILQTPIFQYDGIHWTALYKTGAEGVQNTLH